jgi:hypothetical protein
VEKEYRSVEKECRSVLKGNVECSTRNESVATEVSAEIKMEKWKRKDKDA